MSSWLVKSDPDEYAFADLLRDGRTCWSGVANALALRHLGAMRPGDEVFVYESGKVRAVVGLARVASQPRPDPGLDDPRRLVVDLAAGAPLVHPVPLAAIKADPDCCDFDLVRISRLSVMPVPAAIARRLAAAGAGRRA
ncbi:MAG: EVE domain-containing protein [Thermoanaerobaculia bacterium]|nr:MAG: EVE domain-containing protein [Thermoanaerobaculia bacterium]